MTRELPLIASCLFAIFSEYCERSCRPRRISQVSYCIVNVNSYTEWKFVMFSDWKVLQRESYFSKVFSREQTFNCCMLVRKLAELILFSFEECTSFATARSILFRLMQLVVDKKVRVRDTKFILPHFQVSSHHHLRHVCKTGHGIRRPPHDDRVRSGEYTVRNCKILCHFPCSAKILHFTNLFQELYSEVKWWKSDGIFSFTIANAFFNRLSFRLYELLGNKTVKELVCC